MLQVELLELLREILVASSAERLEISGSGHDQEGSEGAISVALGHGGDLRAFFSQESRLRSRDATRRLAIEQGARRLRACLSMHKADSWPELVFPSASPDKKQLILARMQQFLRALVDASALRQVVLTCYGRVIASALPIEESDQEQLPLLAGRLEKISKETPGTDHGELVQGDVYGRSFWYGAALFGFAHAEYSLDFVRHRSKHVARELAHLLTLLEDGPDEPIKEAPDPLLH